MKIWLPIIIVFLLSAPATAQQFSTKSKKAIAFYQEGDNYRVRRQYGMAVDLFKQAVAKDDGFVEAWYMLGLIYKSVGRQEEAMDFLVKAMEVAPEDRVYPALQLDLAEMYMYKGNYTNAQEQLNGYLSAGVRDNRWRTRAAKMEVDIKYALNNIGKQHLDYKPGPLPDQVNAFPMQYFPVLTADGKSLLFTKREEQKDEDIVITYRGASGEWTTPVSVSRNINTQSNEGTCTISADGRTLIFTSCEGRNGYGSCDLFISNKVGEEWTKPKNLGPVVNSREWDSQPSLSADGRTLYFVSARPGGVGRRDIWVSTKDENEQWSAPINLGKQINTPLDEVSPFIHNNNQVLYFASNGWPGYGGVDLYSSERLAGQWTMPQNLGYPLNTGRDEISLFITADGEEGYYALETSGGNGLDSRLYSFKVPESIKIAHRTNYVFGQVVDDATGQPLKASIELFNLSEEDPVALVYSDSLKGDYLMVLTEGASYALYVNCKGYLFESLSFDYDEGENVDPIERIVRLKKAVAGVSAVLNNIFFDVGKYTLRSESEVELNKVVRFVQDN
ncbi:MAG: hypothetical protein OEX02_15555, partial [Cyclobacteriaceae bacterium]|nr:hypothetical protein [Cyclobacteriaceae bacterium]